MELVLRAAAIAAIAYFLGCFNGAVIVSKYILKDDVRNHGSGNAGLTNFYRTFGGVLTLVVIFTDMVKAVLAVWIGILISSSWATPIWGSELVVYGKYWAGLFCLLGHMFPCMFHFKGGKGILSGGVVTLMIDWRVALVVWAGFIILVALTKYVSLGSCWAAVCFPVVSGLVFWDGIIFGLALFIGALVLYMHRGNIKRLLAKEENKLSFHHKQESRTDQTESEQKQ